MQHECQCRGSTTAAAAAAQRGVKITPQHAAFKGPSRAVREKEEKAPGSLQVVLRVSPSFLHHHIVIIDCFSPPSHPPSLLLPLRGPLTVAAECLTALHAVCRISAALPGFSRFLVNLRVDSAAISSSERSPPCAIQPSSWRGSPNPGLPHDNLLLLLASLLT